MAVSGKTRFIIIVLLVIAAFLTGFLPSYLEKRQLTAELSAARDQVQLLLSQSELGMVLIEVAMENYGNARDRSTRFFNAVRHSASTVRDEDLRAKLQSVLDRRDEINSDLTTLRPETAEKLRALYIELYRVATAQ